MPEDFNNLPEYSKIWIYQSDRPLTDTEKKDILNEASKFTEEWTAHGKDLKAGAEIFHDHFMILSVNERVNGASGCSIDASVRFIRYIEKKYDLNFLDRSKIAYLSEDNTIKLINVNDLRNVIERKLITPHTVIFNNLVKTKGELNDHWKISAENSWMKRYFN